MVWFKQYLFPDNWETIQVLYKPLFSWVYLEEVIFFMSDVIASWSIKVSIAAQNVCKGNDTTWELRMTSMMILGEGSKVMVFWAADIVSFYYTNTLRYR